MVLVDASRGSNDPVAEVRDSTPTAGRSPGPVCWPGPSTVPWPWRPACCAQR